MEKQWNRSRRSVFGRPESIAKQFILTLFELFASPGRALIEVFIRKDFGERYFRLSTVIGTFLFLMIWPLFFIIFSFASSYFLSDTQFLSDGAVRFIGWYLYLFAFLWKGIQHHKAMKDQPSTLDVPRFSYYSGKKLPFFYDIEISGKKGDPRIIECWLEPAPFFLAGIVLTLIGQALGPLLIFCSVVYSISYYVAYREADNWIMDKIDQKIMNEEMENTFLYDKDEQETRGYRFLGRKPNDPEMRKALLGMMIEEEDTPLVS